MAALITMTILQPLSTPSAASVPPLVLCILSSSVPLRFLSSYSSVSSSSLLPHSFLLYFSSVFGISLYPSLFVFLGFVCPCLTESLSAYFFLLSLPLGVHDIYLHATLRKLTIFFHKVRVCLIRFVILQVCFFQFVRLPRIPLRSHANDCLHLRLLRMAYAHLHTTD